MRVDGVLSNSLVSFDFDRDGNASTTLTSVYASSAR